jgi:hypothetical protein
VIRIASLFHPKGADTVRRDQLFEAERLHVEHAAAAEMHAALSAVYRMRAERLTRELAPEPTTLKAVKK